MKINTLTILLILLSFSASTQEITNPISVKQVKELQNVINDNQSQDDSLAQLRADINTLFSEVIDWSEIQNIPSDLLDGDDDTQLDESQVDAFVANNGFLTSENQTLSPTYRNADYSSIAYCDVKGDGNEPNTIISLNPVRVDNGLDVSSNTVTNKLKADYVEITAMSFYEQPQNPSYQRINPVLELLKNDVVVARSASGYQRHGSGHISSSNTIYWIDYKPSPNDQYQIRSQQGSIQNDVLMIDLGHLSVKAVEKVQVIQNVTISN